MLDLKDRQTTHGDWGEGCEVEDKLVSILEGTVTWQHLSNHHRCALRMIVHKIRRIMVGDPDFVDHWDDIGGYAKIEADLIRGTIPVPPAKE